MYPLVKFDLGHGHYILYLVLLTLTCRVDRQKSIFYLTLPLIRYGIVVGPRGVKSSPPSVPPLLRGSANFEGYSTLGLAACDLVSGTYVGNLMYSNLWNELEERNSAVRKRKKHE